MDERKQALRIRTKAFASQAVGFYISLDKSREETRVLGKQLLRSGTSVAVNYREANWRRDSVDGGMGAQETEYRKVWTLGCS